MASRSHAVADPHGDERRQQQRGPLHLVQDGLYSTLRFIARHVKGFWAAIAAFLTVGVLAGVAAASVFGAFASAVHHGLTQSVDESVLRWLEMRRTPALDTIMLELTSLGNGIVLIMIVGIAAVFLWLTHHRWSVYILLGGVLGGHFLNQLLKGAFARDRPSVIAWVDQVHSASFPSGHAMTSIIAYGSVAYLVGRLEASKPMRWATWIVASAIILAIGISRMYLGVHYPSDIIAGFLAGGAWLAILASTVTAVKFFAPRRPEIVVEEEDLDAEERREDTA